MGGITGLEYTALAAVMQMHQVVPGEQRERLAQVRLIERGALEKINEQRK